VTFSLGYYDAMLGNIAAAGRNVFPVAEAIELDDAGSATCCVLRHDVDRIPFRAVKMASLERSHGVRATYYFRRSRSGFYPASAIQDIASMGHEVGLHYETLSRCDGDVDRALAGFRDDLAAFREIAPCVTVSMHGAPLSRHNNQDLAAYFDLTSLALRGDAVVHMRKFDPIYITDTGGAWNAGEGRNLRDVGGRAVADVPDLSTMKVAVPFLAGVEGLLYVSCHPERWPETIAGRAQVYVTDKMVNLLKRSVVSTIGNGPKSRADR